MRKLVFLSGLPRSGSTLLSNLLAQNHDIHATASSGLIDVVRAVRDVCDTNKLWQAMPEQERHTLKIGMLRGVVTGRFSNFPGGICVDKHREWPTLFELMANVIGSRDHIVAVMCVRDVRDVMASFEKLYRTTSGVSATPQQRADMLSNLTAAGRAQYMLRNTEPVGRALAIISDAVTRGWRDRMYFVEYDELCRDPAGVLDGLYAFIDEPRFRHDPDHVVQVTQEDDSVHGFVGLHKIRNKIEPQPPQWSIVYDDVVLTSPSWAPISAIARFWENYSPAESVPESEVEVVPPEAHLA